MRAEAVLLTTDVRLPESDERVCDEAGAIFEELRTPLLRYLVSLGLRLDEAQDLVQEVFLRLHQHLLSDGARDNLRSWIFRVAHNEAVNLHKSGFKRAFRRAVNWCYALEDRIYPGADPEQIALESERLSRLTAAVRRLPEVQRNCLNLRTAGLRFREIAIVLGLSTTTVADNLNKAIARLRKELA